MTVEVINIGIVINTMLYSTPELNNSGFQITMERDGIIKIRSIRTTSGNGVTGADGRMLRYLRQAKGT